MVSAWEYNLSFEAHLCYVQLNRILRLIQFSFNADNKLEKHEYALIIERNKINDKIFSIVLLLIHLTDFSIKKLELFYKRLENSTVKRKIMTINSS